MKEPLAEEEPRSEKAPLLFPLIEKFPHLFVPIPIHIGDRGDIPNGSVDDWRGKNNPDNVIDIVDNNEPLVILSSLDPPIFSTSSYTQKLDNTPYPVEPLSTVLSQFLRESAAKRLLEAQSLLPPGFRFVVHDSWRDLETQMLAYNLCFESIVDQLIERGVLKNHDISPGITELISKQTQKYISLPSPMPDSTNPTKESVIEGAKIPSPHNTGGPVDLGIVKIDDDALEDLVSLETQLSGEKDKIKRANLNFEVAAIYRLRSTMLDFGTDFDHAGEKAELTYYENKGVNEEAQLARRMLYNVMTTVGYQPYSEECWHFNFGNQMAERTKWLQTGEKGTAIYGNIALSPEQKKTEEVHTIAFNELVKLAIADKVIQDPNYRYKVPTTLEKFGLNALIMLALVARTGDPRVTRSLGKPNDLKYKEDLPDEFIQNIKQQLALES